MATQLQGRLKSVPRRQGGHVVLANVPATAATPTNQPARKYTTCLQRTKAKKIPGMDE